MSERKHSRWPLVGLVVAVVAIVTLALTGAAKQVPGLEFITSGHWIANSDLGLVVRVDGATKQPDTQVSVPGLTPGSQVVQDETRGYVVGEDDVTIFGKSTLSVEATVPVPVKGERPVRVQTAGGAYLVFRQSGQIVRMGLEPQVLSAGGPVGPPVATSDGTVWVHRTDSGAICTVRRGAADLPCPAVAPAGHSGALTVSGGRVVFVDTTADTMSVVEQKGLGPPVKIGVDAPPNARIAPADAAGKVAVLDPSGNRMHLVEARVDDKGALAEHRPPAQTVPLPAGEYDGPSVSGESVVLLDHKSSSVRTYDNQGRQKHSTPIPPEKGRPELVRGEDTRVYVDGAEGKHVVVVDKDGSVQPVPVIGGKPDERRQPVPPSAEPTSDRPATQPPDTPVAPPSTVRPVPPPARTNQAQPPPRTPAPPQTPPPIPVTPPGMPANLAIAITTKQVDATVTWAAAPANGAPVTAYHISWQSEGGHSGTETVGAGTFSYVVKGIWQGADHPFTVTVVAQNSAGRGTPATARQVPPQRVKNITLTKGPRAPGCKQSGCYWMHIVMTGFASETRYTVMPHSTSPTYENEGHGVTTDEDGHAEFNAFYYSVAGDTVWVTTGGVESNRLEWTE
ncbi:fibronectin type III domain-containing protein [Lentzea sp. DG1S-22]|uniref:fibronectin type III domain-containing protein n=1 Tax=Lentzea sp. DG1S-22 TaxID=3108822 RepID=UPI002E795B3D|nr:fibronectin type III domain-containing protein [Lentzea sp. DG1S-22]WVH84291.1 fibronectin type III domain-containing protein [Lentzea sp. DG1S-22]